MMINANLKMVGVKYYAAVLGIAWFAALLPLTLLAQNQNPGVLSPQSAHAGLTYGEWSAEWWKWAAEPPLAQNPLMDPNGANCAVGQSGPVWFLAGTLGGPVVRSCTIPYGQMLFFPIGNAFCAGDPGFSFADERACATSIAGTFSNFAAEVDGVAIKGLNVGFLDNPYRALSPKFDLVLTADNIFGAPAGTYKPGAADGVYLMLAPLTAGPHTIHFHSKQQQPGVNPPIIIDATYNIVVSAELQ
jgi:hypothetical protein